MSNSEYFKIVGRKDGERIESRVLEELIQQAIQDGHRNIEIEAYGQHGIGGRLHGAGSDPVDVKIIGSSGQRTGSLGLPNTTIEIMGPASDDIGWLNAGAEIIVHGNATNGTCNGMAQGKVYVGGNIGARGMTMTKSNPRFAPPELWVLGSVGDYFGEFMAGGVSIICGVNPQGSDNVLGYRPLVGMVGGKIFFRGPHKGYSTADAKQIPIPDEEWDFLAEGLKTFLAKTNNSDLYNTLAVREEWQLLVAKTPQEKVKVEARSMSSFKRDVWDKELGKGGLVGDLVNFDMSSIPVITTGELRRFVPVWENRMYLAPCHSTCPSGIPVQERWGLVRKGMIEEAVELALNYTPFPATVCGYLCPNPCMDACTRHSAFMMPIDVKHLGKASINAKVPVLPDKKDKKIAVIGGGPAGLSTAWQLQMAGYEATVFDTSKTLGGKIASVIPESRIPKDVLKAEIERIKEVIPHVNLQQNLSTNDVEEMKNDYDFIIIATGAQQPRVLNVPGKEKMITGMDFLRQAKEGTASTGKTVVVIGAGNAACDAATEASRLGAENITLIDIQEPASFGEERDAAEACGAKFRYPCFTSEITDEGVKLNTGETIPADTVIISIGDMPVTDFIPRSVAISNGYVQVNENGQTTDPKIFAIGDITGLGLITNAIGAGRKVSETIIEILEGKRPGSLQKEMIDIKRVSLEYFDPRISDFDGLDQCGDNCSSCGNCRDCGVCVSVCPRMAISRVDADGPVSFEYAVDAEKCIGCGFCANACPCGIWNLLPNTPMG